MLAKLLLAAGSLLLLLGALEIAARLGGYEPVHAVYSKPSQFWQSDWLLGWSHEPGASGRFVGPRPFPIEFATDIRIGSDGLRGPDIEPLAPGGYRILTLGDSFTVGFEVRYEQTFTTQLGEILSRRFDFPIQSINAGVRGYGTDQSFLYFRERGHLLNPDLVVFVHSNNDWDDNMTLHRPRRPFGKPAFALRESGRLDLLGSPVPVYPACEDRRLDEAFEPVVQDSWLDALWCRVRMYGADHSALFSFVVMRLLRIPAVVEFVINARIPDVLGAGEALADTNADYGVSAAHALTGTLIAELNREVQRRGAKFLLVMRPQQVELMPPGLLRSEHIAPHAVDIYAPTSEVVFVNDSHLNAKGHRLYAEALAEIVAAIVQEDRSSPR